MPFSRMQHAAMLAASTRVGTKAPAKSPKNPVIYSWIQRSTTCLHPTF